MVDGYLVLRGEFDDLEARLLPLAAQGLSYGLHLVVSADRWSELRPALKDLLGSRVELRLGEPGESEVDRRRAAGVPAGRGTGWRRTGPGWCSPRPGCRTRDRRWRARHRRPGGGRRRGLDRPAFAPVAVLPELVHDRRPLPAPPAPGPRLGVPIGVDEEGLARVAVDLAADPHLVCFADAESGKTTLLRVLARGLVRRYAPDEVRIVVVDYRRGLLGAVPASHLHRLREHGRRRGGGRPRHRRVVARPASRAGRRAARAARAQLVERARRSSCSSTTTTSSPRRVVQRSTRSLPLVEFLPQAKDVGLHLVVARRCGGAGRALFDPLLGRLRELAAPGLVMNGSPDEGALVGTVRPQPLPPGRATLVDRRRGTRRVQLAWMPPDGDPDGDP